MKQIEITGNKNYFSCYTTKELLDFFNSLRLNRNGFTNYLIENKILEEIPQTNGWYRKGKEIINFYKNYIGDEKEKEKEKEYISDLSPNSFIV